MEVALGVTCMVLVGVRVAVDVWVGVPSLEATDSDLGGAVDGGSEMGVQVRGNVIVFRGVGDSTMADAVGEQAASAPKRPTFKIQRDRTGKPPSCRSSNPFPLATGFRLEASRTI